MGEIQFNNSALEQAILSGPLHIDREFSLMCLARYKQDLIERQAGASIFEIGLSERRESAKPSVISFQGASFETIKDPKLIQNERLTNPGSIAHLKLSGFMQAESGLSNPGATQLANDLRAAYSNKNISAVILEVNSGGGEVLAGDIIQTAVSERNKPVIAYGWLVGSAAYKAVAGADEIIAANESSRFGSIGVMFSVNKRQLGEIKDESEEIYSDNSKGKNAAFRMALDGDMTGFKQLVNEATDNFHGIVKKNRSLKGSQSKIQETLDGSMFYADDAKGRGLVDSIGNFNFAISRAKRWEKMK